MPEAHIAQKAPYPVKVEEGKTYYWCACGLSAKQPFCDGSHKGSDFTPKPFTADKDASAFLCGCKQSKNGVYCDGTHRSL